MLCTSLFGKEKTEDSDAAGLLSYLEKMKRIATWRHMCTKLISLNIWGWSLIYHNKNNKNEQRIKKYLALPTKT